MIEDLKFYKQVFCFSDGYFGTIEIDLSCDAPSPTLDAYGLTTEIYCSSVELPITSYKLIDRQYAEGMVNRGLYCVKLIQSGQTYNNLEDLYHDYLALKIAGVCGG